MGRLGRPMTKIEEEMAKRLCDYQDEVHELKSKIRNVSADKGRAEQKIKQLQAKLETTEKERGRITNNALRTIRKIEGDIFINIVDPVYSLSVLAIGQCEEIKQLQAKLIKDAT
jgi:chromosome segregation ATPase